MLNREDWLPLAHKLDWSFSYVKDDEVYPEILSGRPWLKHEEWKGWDEPFKTSFAEYVANQFAKESSVFAVQETLGKINDLQKISPSWINGLKLHAATLPLAEFAAVIGNLRAARFGRDSAWRTMATFGALDEYRHTAIPLLLMHELLKWDQQFDWTHKFYHSNNWVAIVARHAFDEVLLASNAIEFAIATNFVFETGFTNVQFIGLSELAHNTGDRIYTIPETGKKGFYDAFYTPVFDDNKNIAAGIAVIKEKTPQKMAENKLSESEMRFRVMADHAPVLLWMSGTDGLCNFFNQTWLNFSGRKLRDELNVGWAEGIHFEDFQCCMDTYFAAFKKREVFEMEYRLRRHDGEYRWILDRGAPRYDDDGNFAGYIGSCIDITERKAAEEDLKSAVEARDEFLSIASHELKTPLTSLKLHLQISKHILGGKKRDSSNSQSIERALEVSEKQTDRLTTLVENLLDVSRIRSSRMELNIEKFNLVSLVNEVVERLQAQVLNSKSQLEIDLPEKLFGEWDKNHLDQVVTNLLSNAIKFSNRKPIHISLSSYDGKAIPKVTDDGIGIAPEMQARIFERFERGVSSQHYPGLGLGLYIVKRIVEAHHGTIAVASELGRGATFTVEIPTRQVITTSEHAISQ